MRKTFLIFTASTVLAMSSKVGAEGFNGAQVTTTAYCCTAPVEADRISIPLTKVVGTGIEFTSGSIQTISGFSIIGSNIDIGDSTIDLDYVVSSPSANGSFNGYVFDFSGPNLPVITGVSLNPLSTFAASSIGLSFDGDTIRYSGAGLDISPTSRVLIDVVFAPAVPEPGTYAMLLAGLGLLGFMARRRKFSFQ